MPLSKARTAAATCGVSVPVASCCLPVVEGKREETYVPPPPVGVNHAGVMVIIRETDVTGRYQPGYEAMQLSL